MRLSRVKPGAASLPPILILASGFLLLTAIAALAAHSDRLLGADPEESGEPRGDASCPASPTLGEPSSTGPASRAPGCEAAPPA